MKKPIKKGRRGKVETDILRNRIVQELGAGISPSAIANTHKISDRYVRLVQEECGFEVDKQQQTVLIARQKDIDAFLDEELNDFIGICRMSTIVLKSALTKLNDKLIKGENYMIKEVTAKEKNKIIKSIPIHDVEAAMGLFEKTHNILSRYQRNASAE